MDSQSRPSMTMSSGEGQPLFMVKTDIRVQEQAEDKRWSIRLGELGVKEWVQSYQQGGRELDVQVQAGPVCLLSDVLSRWTIPRTWECEPWGSANIESQLQALCDGRQERVELEGPGSPGSGAQAAGPRQHMQDRDAGRQCSDRADSRV